MVADADLIGALQVDGWMVDCKLDLVKGATEIIWTEHVVLPVIVISQQKLQGIK